MALSIILTILKIIGIVLLSLLGLLLLVILVVLFVPIRYKVTADSKINDEKKEYFLKVRISWLLHLVRARYDYPSEDGLVVKVGPFSVYRQNEEEKPKKEKIKKQKIKKAKKGKNKNNKADKTNVKASDEAIKSENQVSWESISEEAKKESNDNTSQQKPKGIKEKILYTWQKICDKIIGIRNKIKDIIKNIKKYIHIIQSAEFESAFLLCKSSVVRFFRMLKPRKVKLTGRAGLGSPEMTGYMCAAIGVLSPFFKKQINITPDFENFVVEGKALIKGRIFVIVILMIGIKAFFDKDLRTVIDMFQKEEIVNE